MQLKDYGKHVEMDTYGNVFYYFYGKQHRDDGPAEIWTTGEKNHYHHGAYESKRLRQICKNG